MKKGFLLLACLILTMSCGGGGGGGGGGGSSSGGGSSLSCENNGVPKLAISADPIARADQQFTETYSWCDSEGDISELWVRVTFQGITVTDKTNAADFGITGTSGTKQNKYTWTGSIAGDYFMDFWLKDAKGNLSNTVSLKVTVSAKEMGQYKIFPPSGGGIIERAVKRAF